jgi:hypothetical protein
MYYQKISAIEALQVSNADFIAAVFRILPEQASAAVCSKVGDPSEGGWRAVPADRLAEPLPITDNNFVNCASFRPDQDGLFKARKDNFAATHFLMLDDVGTKVPFARLGEFQPSWAIQTSPGNHQVGIILDPPITDQVQLTQLLNAIIDAGLCDSGATGPATRWARLPQGINGKLKYRSEHGEVFQCRLVDWAPDRRYTVSEILEGLALPPLATQKADELVSHSGRSGMPQNWVMSSDDPTGESSMGRTSLPKLKSLLDAIDPDCDYPKWFNALVSVYHETAGSDEGLALVDEWSSRGKKYKGTKELEGKWASFRSGTSKPMTIGTLKFLAADAGADVAAIMHGDDDHGFEVCETETVSAEGPKRIVIKSAMHPLRRFSISGDLDALERQMVDQVPVLGNIALLGQATALYAAPNTGKTLITLALAIDAITKGTIDPQNFYYMNMDDNGNGLIEKTRFAAELGFEILADGYKGFRSSDFRKAMEVMIEDGTAKGNVVVLDTLKKFTNTMDKNSSSDFAKVIRRFCMKGGTVIALGHTNKHKGSDGKRKYSGTSDIVDDFDCAYVLDTLEVASDAGHKIVEFENIKRRGNVAQAVAYSYINSPEISYDEMLLSVQEVDEYQLDPIRKQMEIRSDQLVLDAVKSSISSGVNTKIKLSKDVAKKTGASHRAVHQILDKYTGADPANHFWSVARGDRGALTYSLLSQEVDAKTDI